MSPTALTLILEHARLSRRRLARRPVLTAKSAPLTLSANATTLWERCSASQSPSRRRRALRRLRNSKRISMNALRSMKALLRRPSALLAFRRSSISTSVRRFTPITVNSAALILPSLVPRLLSRSLSLRCSRLFSLLSSSKKKRKLN